jgi:hypothetical protein
MGVNTTMLLIRSTLGPLIYSISALNYLLRPDHNDKEMEHYIKMMRKEVAADLPLDLILCMKQMLNEQQLLLSPRSTHPCPSRNSVIIDTMRLLNT